MEGAMTGGQDGGVTRAGRASLWHNSGITICTDGITEPQSFPLQREKYGISCAKILIFP
jgi:hypothetical protein